MEPYEQKVIIITLVYKMYVENAIYSGFDRFPLIFGLWF